MRMTPDPEESIRCTVSGCSCVCFRPGSVQLRSCDRCGHGWVAHALDKLQTQPPSSCGPVEVALPGLVFDLSSLVLYGAQAIPVRLKILLDRLYSILTPEQVGHILHTLGWSLGDYVRGYMLQFPSGKVLDRWFMVTPEEEELILKQFLRFGETRPIVELMTLQCPEAADHLSNPELNSTRRSCQTNVNGGTVTMLRNSRADSRLVTTVCGFEKSIPNDHNDTVHHFENFPGGLSLLLPFHFPSSTFRCLVPPKDPLPPSKLTQFLQKPYGTKLLERHKQEGVRRGQENDPILLQSKGEPALKIKTDPDKPNPSRPLWHPSSLSDQDLELRRGMAKQESPTSLSPSLNSSPGLCSSSLYPPISSCSSASLSISQKLQDSHSSPLHPLPSFSSSFLCPLPTSSFSSSLHPLPSSSSSLHPLPSSLCSMPSQSPAGSRKGRVCCGVCGKSFYDKGTLKIHYNAVHLKIKHRCTVAGCTMVFSSLRSRNRHSANPNPRLHTGASRDPYRNIHCEHMGTHTKTPMNEAKQAHKNIQDSHTHVCKEKENTNMLWKHANDADTRGHVRTVRIGINGHTNPQIGCQHSTQRHASSPPSSSHPLSWSQHTNHNFAPNNPQALTPLPPNLRPARSASSLGSPPSLIPIVDCPADKIENTQSLLTNHPPGTTPVSQASGDSQAVSFYGEGKRWRWESTGPVPKKKPRKSSMPVKIERETLESKRNEDEEVC